jgi:hypothetical protein
MITVGIHENLVLGKAAVNEKGTLGLSFRPMSLEPSQPKKSSFFQESQEASVGSSDGDSPLLLFPFKKPTFKSRSGEELTDAELLEFVQDDIKKYRNQLTSIIGAYRTIKDIKFDPWRGTGIKEENFETELLDNDQLKKIYDNYTEDFLTLMAPFLNDDTKPVRLKLVRQSKDKHYATLPSRFLDTNPFIEPMDVPKDKSLLSFTKWEKANGFDNGQPVSQEAADPVPETTPEGSAGVFGQR